MKLTHSVYLVGSGHFGLSHEFDCSVYVVDCRDELVMIDAGAGCDTNSIVENVKRDGLDPSGLSRILLTHFHGDHSGGAHYFHDSFGCRVYIGAEEADVLEQGDEKDMVLDVAIKSGFYSPDYKFANCDVSVRLDNDQSVACGNLTFRALNVPGHSRGSFCYLVDLPEGRALFTGDTVFAEGVIGMLNCEGSVLSDYRKYLKRLAGLNIDILFPGHRVFVLSGGQSHIDQAIESLGLIQLPPNFI
jgi:glyoxylase-like metal-dependent hydrolase (beta-lactamase superfamily II)